MTTLPDPGVREGDRIELVHTNDDYTKLRSGDRGTVTNLRVEYIEPAIGSLVVDVVWDSGSTLSLIPTAGDRWRVVARGEGWE